MSRVLRKRKLEKTPRVTWQEIFMQFVECLSRRSSCIKYKTAAIIVKGTQIISMGYNGTFAKAAECSDVWHAKYLEKYPNGEIPLDTWLKSAEFRLAHREWSVKNEIHAEENALGWVTKNQLDNTQMYTLYSPCDSCAKQIISYNIKTVFYRIQYPNGINALEILKLNGIECCQI